MEWIAQVHKALAYMEEHLLEDLCLEDAARLVYRSSYEFHRAFSFITGITPGSYIRMRRLSLAGREVMETGEKITDIALRYGYETPESFTKAFTRFHGVSPKAAREEHARLKLFNPLVIKLTVEGGNSMDYSIVQTEKKRFIALVRSFSNSIINDDENHDIPDFWGECREKNLLACLQNLRPAGKRDLYGLCSPTKKGEDTFRYGIGVLVDEDTAPFDLAALTDAGYTLWDVEPGTYVVFDCVGEDGDCISETWSRFYKEFLPQMGYEASEATDYEIYLDHGREGVFCELWIPVRKK